MESKNIVIYSVDLWEGAVFYLRLRSPLSQLGYSIIHWKFGDPVVPEHIRDAAYVVIQRNFPMMREAYAQVMEIARRLGKRVIYETDDLLFDLPEQHPLKEALSDYVIPILKAVTEADLVTVSTAALAESMSLFHPAVVTLPNTLDDAIWKFTPVRQGEEASKVIIGYMGGATHQADLELVTPVLENLLEKYGDKVGLRFLGCQPPETIIKFPQVEWNPLDLRDYVEFIRVFSQQQVDIWIAPLQDNRFNRAKSAVKFLEYSAVGGVGVYSRLEPYDGIVLNGKNGFLAGSLEEWFQALSDLIEHPDMRYEMACAAQQTAQEWKLSLHVDKWVSAYRQVDEITPLADPLRKARLETILRIVGQVQERNDDLERSIQTLWGTVRQQEKQLQDASARLQDADARLEDALIRYQEANIKYTETHMQLQDILESRSWKLMQQLQNIRQRIVPVKGK